MMWYYDHESWYMYWIITIQLCLYAMNYNKICKTQHILGWQSYKRISFKKNRQSTRDVEGYKS